MNGDQELTRRLAVTCHLPPVTSELVLAAGLAPALAMLSTSCLCIGLRKQNGWSLQPVLPRRDFLTKEVRRLLRGGEMVAVPGAAPDAAGL